MNIRTLAVTLASLASCCIATGTLGQCEPDWIVTPGFGYAGVHGNVGASVMWDPDGPGPEPELLIVGGIFDAVDNTPAAHVAAWDGQSWSNLAGGVTEGHIFERVSALAVYNGQLIVGGTFGKAGDVPVNGIAAWDGTEWHPLGQGIYGGFSEPEVAALEVYNGRLIAGGAFTSAGDGPANFIAAWDGTDWAPLGVGTSFAVTSLQSHAGDLFVGGQFTSAGNAVPQTAHLAKWDGTNWHSVGGGTNNTVWDFQVFDDALYVGGGFTQVGSTQASFVARWDGSHWSTLDSGTSGTVSALAEHLGELIVGGQFQFAGGTNASNIARWDGSSWDALGEGVGSQAFNTGVRTLTVRGTQLFVGGPFQEAGGETAAGMALWDAETWTSFGGRPFNVEPRGLTIFEDNLVVSGYTAPFSSTRQSNVVRWDGIDWTILGGNFDELVWDVGVHNDSLLAFGWFESVDGNPSPGIARWDGSAWVGLGSGLGGGYLTAGLCMNTFQDDLIIGGDFTLAGGVAVSHIARWDGSQWHDLDGGIDGDLAFVWDLQPFQGGLIAAGEFDTAGGAPVNNIARWDGTAWTPLGSGVTNGFLPSAKALTIYQGDLIVGGEFTTAGGIPAANIARWDGSQWHAIGAGIPDHGVTALAVYDSKLYAGGQFIFADQSNTRIMVWDGSSWKRVGGGVNGGVSDFALLESELLISGGFSVAGETVAPGLARWSETNTPWFAQQPRDAEACLGDTKQFQASLALGYESASLQWRRDGEPLADGPTGYGSTLSGTDTGTLTITDIHAPDNAIYVCLAENGCDSAPSDEARLSVCVADYNCDGNTDTIDVLAFLNDWTAGQTHADINGDGSTNTQDVLAFLNAWNTGCHG